MSSGLTAAINRVVLDAASPHLATRAVRLLVMTVPRSALNMAERVRPMPSAKLLTIAIMAIASVVLGLGPYLRDVTAGVSMVQV